MGRCQTHLPLRPTRYSSRRYILPLLFSNCITHDNPCSAVSTYLLPRLLGHARATALLLTGDTVTPSSPFLQGLYYSILPTREEVFPAAKAFAEDLAANTSMPAVAYTKSLLQHPGESPEENHLLDSRAIRVLGRSGDAKEGVDSFRERRVPKFRDTLGEATWWSPWVCIIKLGCRWNLTKFPL